MLDARLLNEQTTNDSAGLDCRILAMRKYARWPAAAD